MGIFNNESAMVIHHPKRRIRFTTTYIIALGFLSVIIIGTILLALPVSAAKGVAVKLSDALFVATSAVCVTGLVTVPTYSTWSIFGQAVILLLVQIGGLGVISFTTVFMSMMGHRIGLRQRQLIRDAYNLETDAGLRPLVKKILIGTLIVELTGAFLYCLAFVPEYGPAGVWKSLFLSVSAFCNAGMDLFGPISLIPYRDNVFVNLVTMTIIILGGLGFPIWFLIMDSIKALKDRNQSPRKLLKGFPLYAKIVFCTTAFLIVLGTVLVFIMEYDNKSTIGELPLFNKIIAALFQSVTTRTAGFCTVPQEELRLGTVVVSCILMFIGGSPSGTAGGIKTTTIAVMAASIRSSLTERNSTEVMGRMISAKSVRRAMSVFMVSLNVMLISLIAFCTVQEGDFAACVFEVVSAIATVGLSRDLTGTLGLAGKLVIVASMYLGRIGPISLSLFYNTKKYTNLISYPEEEVPVG